MARALKCTLLYMVCESVDKNKSFLFGPYVVTSVDLNQYDSIKLISKVFGICSVRVY